MGFRWGFILLFLLLGCQLQQLPTSEDRPSTETETVPFAVDFKIERYSETEYRVHGTDHQNPSESGLVKIYAAATTDIQYSEENPNVGFVELSPIVAEPKDSEDPSKFDFDFEVAPGTNEILVALPMKNPPRDNAFFVADEGAQGEQSSGVFYINIQISNDPNGSPPPIPVQIFR